MSSPNGTRPIVVLTSQPRHVASRFVCCHTEGEQYVSLDTSDILNVENYDDNAIFEVVRVLPDDGALPFGISGALEDWDDFEHWPTPPEAKALFTEARREAPKTPQADVSGLQPRAAVLHEARESAPETPRHGAQVPPRPDQQVLAASAQSLQAIGSVRQGSSGAIVSTPQSGGGLEALSRALQSGHANTQVDPATESQDDGRVDLRVFLPFMKTLVHAFVLFATSPRFPPL
jgi:hypothetical protein